MSVKDFEQPQPHYDGLYALDALGRRIEPGMVVTYPGRFSSSLWVNIGIVRGVRFAEDRRRWVGVTPLLVERLEKRTHTRFNADGTVATREEVLDRKLVEVSVVDRVTITGASPDLAEKAVMGEGRRGY